MEKIKLKKILILGSTGMLGHTVYYTLKNFDCFEILDVSYRKQLHGSTIICDVKNTYELQQIILEHRPDVIVNCVGVLIEGTNKNIENAIFLNAYFPHFLINICNKINAKLIHISTDCVFNGNRGKNSENTIPDAIDNYGKTKSLGEFNIKKHLCIRTSIIGPEIKKNGEGLFQWIFKQKGDIYGFKRVFWSGVTTLELSKAIKYSIVNQVDGLWNLTNEVEISKYDLLKKIVDVFKLSDINLKKDYVKKSNKSLISIREINYQVPSYDVMLSELNEYHKNFFVKFK